MRRLFLAGDHVDFDFFETGGFQPAMQVAVRKTQPTIAVEFTGFLKFVRE